MKQTTIRLEDNIVKMLNEIDERPTTAIQEAVEILVYLRKNTLRELKGMFTREEIIALADSFNGLMPTWQIMCSTSVLVAHTEDAEKYQYSASQHGADIVKLLKKLNKLTAGQSAILQLELTIFWRGDNPDLETLIKSLL